MVSFQQELQKEAVVRPLLEALRKAAPWRAVGAGAGSGAGIGAMGGAGLGTAVGGVRGYQEAREQGAGRGIAALSGVGGAVGGGIKGALLGAGAGAGAGALAGKLRPEMVTRLARETAEKGGPIGASSRFGQRQLHQLTGWQPKEVLGPKGKYIPGIEQLRGGAYAARSRVEAAEKALKDSARGKVPLTYLEKVKSKLTGMNPEEVGKMTSKRVSGEAARARKALPHAEKAQEMGLTNFPGYLKGVAGGKAIYKGRPVSRADAAKAGLAEQWHGGGPVMKSMMVGFPAAAVGGAALTPGGGAEEYGQALGTVGYTMAPFTLGGSVLAGEGLSKGLGAVGRGIDRLRGKKKKKPPPFREAPKPPAEDASDSGMTVPSERHGSPTMMGETPEIGT